jgi:hypothetical protein
VVPSGWPKVSKHLSVLVASGFLMYPRYLFYTSLAPFGMFFPFIIGISFWEIHQVRKECVEKSKPLLQCGFEGEERK